LWKTRYVVRPIWSNTHFHIERTSREKVSRGKGRFTTHAELVSSVIAAACCCRSFPAAYMFRAFLKCGGKRVDPRSEDQFASFGSTVREPLPGIVGAWQPPPVHASRRHQGNRAETHHRSCSMSKEIARGCFLACPKTYDSESNALFSLERTESSGLQARARFIGQAAPYAPTSPTQQVPDDPLLAAAETKGAAVSDRKR
jgi:hypothetical protein